MRSDYALYIIAIICLLIALLISFMNYAQTTPTYITGDVTDLVIMMFSAILGIVFIGLGYVVRPKKAMPPPPPKPKLSAPPKPAKEKPKKEPEKKAVKKRRPRKKT